MMSVSFGSVKNFTLALGCQFSLLMVAGVQFFVLHGDMLRDVMQSEREKRILYENFYFL